MRLSHYRRLWRQLHSYAAAQSSVAPIRPAAFLRQFDQRIGCRKCQRHWRALLAAHPPALHSRRAFFRWTVRMHNAINAQLGKPILPFAEACRLFDIPRAYKMKNHLLSLLAVAALLLASVAPAAAWEAKGDYGTATATSGAATLSKQAGLITSEALTTAAASAYTLTLTNTRITAASIVDVSVDNGTNTQGIPIRGIITPGAGSVVIKVYNLHASQALNGTLKIRYAILK